MRSSRQVYEEIREEMRVGLTAEFHENFRRKAFFDQPWKPRKESGWKSSRRKSPRDLREETSPALPCDENKEE